MPGGRPLESCGREPWRVRQPDHAGRLVGAAPRVIGRPWMSVAVFRSPVLVCALGAMLDRSAVRRLASRTLHPDTDTADPVKPAGP